MEPGKVDTYLAGKKLDTVSAEDADKIKQLFAEYDNLEKKDKDGMSIDERLSTFGQLLWQYWEINRAFRRPKEMEWLESLRQYKGLYDPEVDITPGLSRVYPKLTRSKENQVLSRLMEMLFPEQDKNWEIEPSPDPKLLLEVVEKIAMSLITKDENGQPVLPTKEEIKQAVMKFAKDRCGNMSTVIDGQLEEMKYQEETKKVLRSGLRYGTGIMKGPLIRQRESREWVPNQHTGEYREDIKSEDVPYKEQTRIWDYYPDMSTTEPEQMDGCFERHVFTKHDLRQLMKRKDFNADVIREYMKNNPDGDYIPEDWEVDLQAIEIEAGTGKETAVSGSPSSTRQAFGYLRKLGKKYVVLEFWGYVDGQDLNACGENVENPELEHGSNVWILGKQIIKAKIYERANEMYNFFYYEKDETSIFGEGLARVMRHSQLSIAAGARKVLDDAAVCGPQIECNYNLMVPGSDISDVYSRKVWYREGRGVEAQYPAIRIINIEPHTEELFMIIKEFKQFADEETCLPSWMMGQTTNTTAQEASGRMREVTISIKDVVKNFDVFTEKNIRDLYYWNMEFSENNDIKGDYLVKARGVSSLVMKEIRMQALTQMTSTLTEEERQYIPWRDFLIEKMKAYDIKINIKSEEDVAKEQQAKVDQRAKELTYKDAEAEIAKKNAQAYVNLAKAKEKNQQLGQQEEEHDIDMAGKKMDIAGKVIGAHKEMYGGEA